SAVIVVLAGVTGGTSAGRCFAGITSAVAPGYPVTGFFDDFIEQWHEQRCQEGCGQHAANDDCADGMLGCGTGTRGKRQWRDPENERQRSHDDRPEAQPYRIQGGLAMRFALFALEHRELNDQDGILGRQANQYQHTNLEINALFDAAQPDCEKTAKQREW